MTQPSRNQSIEPAVGTAVRAGRRHRQHAGHCAAMPRDASRDNGDLMPTNPGRPRRLPPPGPPAPPDPRHRRRHELGPRRDLVRRLGRRPGQPLPPGARGARGDGAARPAARRDRPRDRRRPGRARAARRGGRGELHRRRLEPQARSRAPGAATVDRGRSSSATRGGCPRPRGSDPASFDAAVFLLSIQDMDPLEQVLASASWAVRARRPDRDRHDPSRPSASPATPAGASTRAASSSTAASTRTSRRWPSR